MTVEQELNEWRRLFAVRTSSGWQTPAEAAKLRDEVYAQGGKLTRKWKARAEAAEEENARLKEAWPKWNADFDAEVEAVKYWQARAKAAEGRLRAVEAIIASMKGCLKADLEVNATPKMRPFVQGQLHALEIVEAALRDPENADQAAGTLHNVQSRGQVVGYTACWQDRVPEGYVCRMRQGHPGDCIPMPHEPAQEAAGRDETTGRPPNPSDKD